MAERPLKLKVDKSGMEQGTRGEWEFPVLGGVRYGNIASFEGARFECHFHTETELTHVGRGEMYYQADDRVFVLQAGDAVFVNSEVMHAGWQKDGQDCFYVPFNFATVMVYGYRNSLIEQRYVEPLLREHLLPYLVMRHDNPEHAELLASVRRIIELRQDGGDGYELLLKSELCRFWYLLYSASQKEGMTFVEQSGGRAVKKVIAYMEEHYAEKFSLAELSEICGLSRSALCHTFRRYTGRTPFTYLQHLRVRRSLPFLLDPDLSVSQVAERVGFSGGSYYAEVFRRFIGVTPLCYRRRGRA